MNIQEIMTGMELTWMYEPRGGYGYSYPVDATVLSVGSKRVKIQVKKRSGEMVERFVTPERLRLHNNGMNGDQKQRGLNLC